MTKLIKLSDFEGETKKLKPVEFVEIKNMTGQWETPYSICKYYTVVHIGNMGGWDYFIAFDSPNRIYHYRGHLNDGVIE